MPAFSLVLFSVAPDFIRKAVQAGIRDIIVDCECRGKERRQAGADTEINSYTAADVRRVRRATSARVLCRINGPGPDTPVEVEAAIQAGADELMIPMVRSPWEVEAVLRAVGNRRPVGILVETVAAVNCVSDLASFPLSRVYVGLNDLAIERRTPNLFTALVDGTLDRIRSAFDVPFGFGGLTLPDRGSPVPCRLLIGEMARLSCSFSFLRRSFCADIRGRDINAEVPRILEALSIANSRTAREEARDRSELLAAVESWEPAGAPV